MLNLITLLELNLLLLKVILQGTIFVFVAFRCFSSWLVDEVLQFVLVVVVVDVDGVHSIDPAVDVKGDRLHVFY